MKKKERAPFPWLLLMQLLKQWNDIPSLTSPKYYELQRLNSLKRRTIFYRSRNKTISKRNTFARSFTCFNWRHIRFISHPHPLSSVLQSSFGQEIWLQQIKQDHHVCLYQKVIIRTITYSKISLQENSCSARFRFRPCHAWVATESFCKHSVPSKSPSGTFWRVSEQLIGMS